MLTMVLAKPILDATSKQLQVIGMRSCVDDLIGTLSHIMSGSM